MTLSQTQRLYAILRDQRPHSTDELQERVYGRNHLGNARIAARVGDVKKRYGVNVLGWKDRERPTLYWYQLHVRQPVQAFLPPKKAEAIKNQPLF